MYTNTTEMFQRDMGEEGEGAPLLRGGRPYGSNIQRNERGSSVQQPAAAEAGDQQHDEDVGRARRKRSRVEPVAGLSRAGSRPLVLAVVTAVGAALLVIGVGFMSAPSSIAGSRQRQADTRASLVTSPVAPGEGAVAVGGAVEGGQSEGVAAAAATGEGGGTTTASGGWRSQANRASSSSGTAVAAVSSLLLIVITTQASSKPMNKAPLHIAVLSYIRICKQADTLFGFIGFGMHGMVWYGVR